MSKKSLKTEVVVVLPDIRSAHNVGSIFRTSDAAGITRIVLSGYTPRPIDKYGKVQKEIAKTALGAELTIPWVYEKSNIVALNKLKTEGFTLVAVEQSPRSIDYKKYKIKNKIAFVFGNEVTGLPKGLLSKCDDVIEIPMKGKKESLNVGVSAGIVLFRILGV